MENSLQGKIIAVTGSTGGLGREICDFALARGAELIMLDRNQRKAEKLESELLKKFPSAVIARHPCQMEDAQSVKAAAEFLIEKQPDFFIANAGAYAIARKTCDSGLDNVYQINFAAPYYLCRRLIEGSDKTKIIAVGSLAHSFAKLNSDDIEAKKVKSASKIYGNAKRLLMLSLHALCKNTCRLAVTHPGVSPTGITAAYPKLVKALIKYPMKIIFPSPKKASRNVTAGIEKSTPFGTWLGPRVFGIWGKPKEQKLKACYAKDFDLAVTTAEKIYENFNNL